MELVSLTAVSPIDGRYASKTESFRDYFSEYALIKYRIKTEVEYFIALCEYPLPQLTSFDHSLFPTLQSIYKNLSLDDALKIKEIEKTTNHDVKAVEYFLREKFAELGINTYNEFIHFGLTSQDINNTAFPMMLYDAFNNVVFPKLLEINNKLLSLAEEWKDIPMLAHTHGQPASPTRLGKEFYVFFERIKNQIDMLANLPFEGKFGGATGNFNAHHAAYPNIDWTSFGNRFLKEKLNLSRQQTTTQIEHYDMVAAFCQNMTRINTILIDLDRDVWTYISMEYFKQTIKKNEVGSSAMPHKVNPIDFENSEGNLGLANAIFNHLAMKLPISRMQRDLTDSTVIRNIGVPLSYSMIAYSSLLKGLDKIYVNEDKLRLDLDNNWAVIAEAIQTILRRESYPNPYEALKQLTRKSTHVTRETLMDFIDNLDVRESVKDELRSLSPTNYLGINTF